MLSFLLFLDNFCIQKYLETGKPQNPLEKVIILKGLCPFSCSTLLNTESVINTVMINMMMIIINLMIKMITLKVAASTNNTELLERILSGEQVGFRLHH